METFTPYEVTNIVIKFTSPNNGFAKFGLEGLMEDLFVYLVLDRMEWFGAI